MAWKLMKNTLTNETKNRGVGAYRQALDLNPGYSDCILILP